ncbi:colorectal mutant cancer protein isoform X2 [Chrysoperla carnea]|uniref:colorectal mutant cancer protein isoform X2 n=1 Tax=Chrysoperla carnea TaxID=189513 RepID=UPI001D07508E|nr:colorectal mutant cancer protein isoform X2 [Chrysoperla carnea]
MADTDCASESASSVYDEERVRRLFQACDADGDGYIDSHDLLAVCRELSLEDSLDELMLQLGADAQGRISYEQFLQRRLALRPEIDAIKSAHSPLPRDTSSDNSQGKLDSWEWDSGARDLSPVSRPDVLQKHNNKHSSSQSGSMEHIFKERLQQELAIQSQRYEEQLTELHSVIAELTRKLHQQRTMAIAEEDEQSDVGTSAHEGSITCPLDVSELEPTDNDRTYADDLSDTDTKLVMPESPLELPEPKLITRSQLLDDTENLIDQQNTIQLQKEVDSLKAEILSLRSQIEFNTDNNLEKNHIRRQASPKISNLDQQASNKHHPESYDEEDIINDDEFENDDKELKNNILIENKNNLENNWTSSPPQTSQILTPMNNCYIKSSSIVPIHTSCSTSGSANQNQQLILHHNNYINNKNQPRLETFKQKTISEKSELLVTQCATNTPTQAENLIGMNNQQPIAKMAERVRLRRTERPITGSEIANTGLCSTQVAEHLVSDLRSQSELQEQLAIEQRPPDEQAFETEIHRLTTKIDNLKSQNNVLSLTLTENKAHCDKLTLLCGKYESNAVALRVALGLSDRAIEAYDVLLALLETELSLDESNEESIENRKSAESVALQLLARLDENDTTMLLASPWQHNIYANTNSTQEQWTEDHETRLRAHVSRLKANRSNVEGTAVILESLHNEISPISGGGRHGTVIQDMRKLDLETAVLMQELMALREDKAELTAKVYHLEKEKIASDLKLACLETQQRAQTSALNNIRGQLADTEALLSLASQQKDRSSYSEKEHAEGVELELIQALARESRLKVRLQELVNTLEQVTKNAEARLLEGRELVADLNQANSTLVQTVDRNHKKYQARLKKLEQQMLAMVERHSVQVQTLKQRIAVLEALPSHSSGNSETSL